VTNALLGIGCTASGVMLCWFPLGPRVRIRGPFRDFSGKAMYHCHILDHEDLGMMGIIEVI
jgi:FtsP/CotA-like multicopper oxidase with cupredoxin domain